VQRSHRLASQPAPEIVYAKVRIPRRLMHVFANRYIATVPYAPGSSAGRWDWDYRSTLDTADPETGEPLGEVVSIPGVIIPFAVCSWYGYAIDHDWGGSPEKRAAVAVIHDIPHWPVARRDATYYTSLADSYDDGYHSALREHIASHCTPDYGPRPKWLRKARRPSNGLGSPS
jgi:hypothetical protein